MGSSGPATSMRALSTPKAAKAARRCSTVLTLTPSEANAVPRPVADTLSSDAGISGDRSKSVRTKRMPWSVGAGRTATLECSPECTPIPEREKSPASVCWRVGRDEGVTGHFLHDRSPARPCSASPIGPQCAAPEVQAGLHEPLPPASASVHDEAVPGGPTR